MQDAAFFHSIDYGPCTVPTWYPLFLFICVLLAVFCEFGVIFFRDRKKRKTFIHSVWIKYCLAQLSTLFMILGYYLQGGFYEVALLFQTCQQLFFTPCVLEVVHLYYKPMFHRRREELDKLNILFKNMIRVTLILMFPTSFGMFITCRMSDYIYNGFAISNLAASIILVLHFSIYLLIAMFRLGNLLKSVAEVHKNIKSESLFVALNCSVNICLPVLTWIIVYSLFGFAPFFYLWIWVSNVISPLMFLKTAYALVHLKPTDNNEDNRTRRVDPSLNDDIRNRKTATTSFPRLPMSSNGRRMSTEAEAYLSNGITSTGSHAPSFVEVIENPDTLFSDDVTTHSHQLRSDHSKMDDIHVLRSDHSKLEESYDLHMLSPEKS